MQSPVAKLSYVLATLAAVAAAGCHMRDRNRFQSQCGDECYTALATEIDYPVVTPCSAAEDCWAAVEPQSIADPTQVEYWDLSLQEVVHTALAQSQVIRDLGGAVLRSPSTIETRWDPALIETDPRLGVDAALSAYDAQFTTSVYGEKNDRALNNEFFGGGTRLLQQDTAVVQAQIAKRGAAGTEMALRHYIDYDSNNAPSNLFYSAWNTNFEAQLRQPLLQGAGTEFSRIAGASTIPGLYNGVLIARVNTDIELTEFEASIRDLVSNLENAYWDLYFAYRDLDAKVAARDAALETWRRIHALYKAGRRGGEAEKEAQAREQFFRFQEDVENALSGRLIDGTRTDNGSSGGTFRAGGGVHVAERRLRLLMGLPPSDGRLIRPADEPVTAPIVFDWSEITRESLVRRVELRRQRWLARRFELELTASKNYLLPRLDAVGRYRWRGFGDDLLHSDTAGRTEFDNAYANLTSGHFQEWQVGVELNVPLGYRKGFAAVRNAELQLCRARAVLREQEHAVLHDAASSVAEFDRAAVVARTTASRLEAARQQLAAVQAAYDADKAPLDLLLEAQRNLADAESRHYRSLAEYAVAIKNVHYSKGTLLDYDGVMLSESSWPGKAYADASRREARRGRPLELNYTSARAPLVSQGAFDQHVLDGAALAPVVEASPIEAAAPAASQSQPTPDGEPPQDQPAEEPESPTQGEPLPTGDVGLVSPPDATSQESPALVLEVHERSSQGSSVELASYESAAGDSAAGEFATVPQPLRIQSDDDAVARALDAAAAN
jgi:outer membrane protein TolC